jgi:hypothetical protein
MMLCRSPTPPSTYSLPTRARLGSVSIGAGRLQNTRIGTACLDRRRADIDADGSRSLLWCHGGLRRPECVRLVAVWPGPLVRRLAVCSGSWRRCGVRPVAPSMSMVSRWPRPRAAVSRCRHWRRGRGRGGARPHRCASPPRAVGGGRNGSGCREGRGAGEQPAAAGLSRQRLIRPCSDHGTGKCGGGSACPGRRIPAPPRWQAQPPAGVRAVMPSRLTHRRRANSCRQA